METSARSTDTAASQGESSNGLPVSKRLREKIETEEEEGRCKRVRCTDAQVEDSTEPATRHPWRANQMVEDYVEMASNIMLTPLSLLGTYGYDSSKQQYPLEAVSALGYIKSPLRRPMIIERWSPYEIALFEGALAEYGKDFHQVQRIIGETKTTKEIIDFYYMWKKTSHYKKWKKQYVPPHLDLSDDEMDAKK